MKLTCLREPRLLGCGRNKTGALDSLTGLFLLQMLQAPLCEIYMITSSCKHVVATPFLKYKSNKLKGATSFSHLQQRSPRCSLYSRFNSPPLLLSWTRLDLAFALPASLNLLLQPRPPRPLHCQCSSHWEVSPGCDTHSSPLLCEPLSSLDSGHHTLPILLFPHFSLLCRLLCLWPPRQWDALRLSLGPTVAVSIYTDLWSHLSCGFEITDLPTLLNLHLQPADSYIICPPGTSPWIPAGIINLTCPELNSWSCPSSQPALPAIFPVR